MNREEEKLLALVLDKFSQTFGKKAVLRGGMVLRVLGSARYTNDLDYVFVPYKSKKEVLPDIIACIESIPDTKYRYSLNSQCLRIVLTMDDTTIQVEVKVNNNIKTSSISNQLLATQYNLPKRLIPIVDHSISLANKLAAWNERRIVRDIYDIWFFLTMHVTPDEGVLLKRLKKPRYSPTVKASDYFQGRTVREFYDFIRARVSKIPEKEFEDQLLDYLSPEDVVGLRSLILSALTILR